MKDPRTWSGRQALIAAVVLVVVALGAVFFFTRSDDSPAAGAVVPGVTSSPSGTDAPTDPAATSTDPASSASPSPSTSSSTGFGGSTSPSSSRTPLPTYSGDGKMVPPTIVKATVGGCQPQAGGGWLATFDVTFSGGKNWAVQAERGPVNGSGDRWTVGIESKDTVNSITLDTVQVGGGSPFSSTRLKPPGTAVVAACPG